MEPLETDIDSDDTETGTLSPAESPSPKIAAGDKTEGGVEEAAPDATEDIDYRVYPQRWFALYVLEQIGRDRRPLVSPETRDARIVVSFSLRADLAVQKPNGLRTLLYLPFVIVCRVLNLLCPCWRSQVCLDNPRGVLLFELEYLFSCIWTSCGVL